MTAVGRRRSHQLSPATAQKASKNTEPATNLRAERSRKNVETFCHERQCWLSHRDGRTRDNAIEGFAKEAIEVVHKPIPNTAQS